MNAERRILGLLERGLQLWAEGGQLRYRAPPGTLSPAERDELAPHKATILGRLDRDSRYAPCSFAQERLFFLHRLDPSNAADNLHRAWRLTGNLDPATLAAALGAVVRRHEALRTTVTSLDDRPCQVITAAAPCLSIADLTALGADHREAALHRLAAGVAANPFALENGFLARFVLVRLAPRRHAFLVVLHHAVADGWSYGIFLRELSAVYAALLRARRPALAALPLQYADVAALQRAGPGQVSELRYWRRRLADLDPLELPADRPRPPVSSGRGAAVRRPLPGALVAAVGALGRAARASSFMTLLAGFLALTHRLTGRRDVAVGIPIAGRHRGETEGVIGCFVNPLVLRVGLAGDPAFRELLARTRETALGAYAHQELPFAKLVEALEPRRDLARSPLFQVMCVAQSGLAETPRLPGLELELLEIEPGTAQLDLTLTIDERDGDVVTWWRYATDLFDAATIVRLAERYAALLAAAAAEPGARLRDLPLLMPGERQQVLVEWNDTADDGASEGTVLDSFSATAGDFPEAAAVSAEHRLRPRWLSYSELARRAARLARQLAGMGVGRGRPVAVLLPRDELYLTALLAVLRAGGVYLPLDPSQPAPRLARILRDSGAAWVLTRGEPAGALVRQRAAPARRRRGPIGPDDLAYLLYTSGSTGTPKGVSISHRGLLNHLRSKVRSLRLTARDTVAQTASQAFDISLWQLLAALLVGGRVHVVSGDVIRDPYHLLNALQDQRISVLQIVPSWLGSFLEAIAGDPAEPAALRWLVSTGEALPADLSRRWRRRFPATALLNAYGPTECADNVSDYELNGAEGGRSVPVGRPIGNLRLYVLDAALGPLPVGSAGEVCVAGAGVGLGYRGDPRRTAPTFVPDAAGAEPGGRLYRTGDLARLLPDGNLEFLGRHDQQVKLRGFRIELGEVETALSQLPEIAEAAVLVWEKRPGDPRLVAFVAPRLEVRAAPAARRVAAVPPGFRRAIRQRLLEVLPDHMVPAAFVVLPALPRRPSGKLDRAALGRAGPVQAGPVQAGPVFGGPKALSHGLVEEFLAGIWCQVLGRPAVGSRDHFFALGGHSLQAVQVVSRVRRAFGVELSIRRLFERPVLADLVRFIDDELHASREAPPALAGPPASNARGGPRDLPLAAVQMPFWFLYQLVPESPVANMPAAWIARGRLDEAAFAAALDEMVRRHEVLRTSFPVRRGDPRQVVAAAASPAFGRIDLLALPEARSRCEAKRLARREAGRPFDLAREHLLRCLVLRIGRRRHLLFFNFHHINSDGWSLGVFSRELGALYDAFATRPAGSDGAELPGLSVQYGDVVRWQRHSLKGAVRHRLLDYWRRQLAGAPPLELPSDRPRPAVQSYRGAGRSMTLSPVLTDSLRSLGLEAGASLYMTLLAAFLTLLGRCTGRRDFTVGSPVANREREEIEELIGLLMNTLVLRADLSGNPPFREFLERVRETALEAYAHQALPFDTLVAELHPNRDLARAPFYQVVFVLQNLPDQTLRLSGLELEQLPLGTATSYCDLMLTLGELGDRLAGGWTYSTDLFHAVTVGRLSRQFTTLLAGAASTPDCRVDELPLLAAEERHQLLAEWNATSRASTPATVVEELAAQAAAAPAAAAVVASRPGAPDLVLSYGELVGRAARLAERLRTVGVGPESRVGLCLERCVDMVTALWGILAAGGVCVPLDPRSPRERTAFQLRDTGAEALVTRREPTRGPDRLAPVVIGMQGGLSRPGEGRPPALPAPPSPRQAAYVIYTSGSSGRPKGVQVDHRALANHTADARRAFGIGPGDRVLQFAGLFFDASAEEIYPCLTGGATLVLRRAEQQSGRELLEQVKADRISVLDLPTAFWHQMAGDSGLEVPRALRLVVIGGEAASGASLARWRRRVASGDRPPRLVNTYGPTETTVVATRWEASAGTGAAALGDPPIGRPIAGATAFVLDPRQRPLPVGAVGEIHLGGAGLARAYCGRPRSTAASFVPNPFARRAGARLYKTGDQARFLNGGELEFSGRRDRQVKIRGVRVEPGEIEVCLRRHPEVAEAAVTVRKARGRRRIVAFWVPRTRHAGRPGPHSPRPAALRAFLADTLPEVMVPATFVMLPALPLNGHGKVDRGALPDAEAERTEPQKPVRAPRDPLEEALAGLVADTLGLENVGVTDDFFSLGGHSLLAVRLISRIERQLAVRVPMAIFFAAPTVEGLARRLAPSLKACDTRYASSL